MKHLMTGLMVCAGTALLPSVAMAGPIEVMGVWQTQDGGGHVRIADCGDGTPCGTLVWIDPAQAEGEIDALNPDVSLRGQSLVGMKMLWGFKVKKNEWKSGKIYDPESGKIYGSKLKVKSNGMLQVKGCIGPICQTQKWTRVSPTSLQN